MTSADADSRQPQAIDDALDDADAYRQLGLETIDSTGRPPTEVADALAATIMGTK